MMMKLNAFNLRGKFGHFLRAEAGVSALTYPIPPRTVLMGIIGAILGLEKDQPQIALEPMHVAVAGNYPMTHWHKAKLRKDPPELLPYEVKKSQKAEKNTKSERASLIIQEWLFNPSYTIWVALPEPYQDKLETRLKNRLWHFQPSLGLSEMMADIEYIETVQTNKLPYGTYNIESIIKQEDAELDITKIYEEELALEILRMPRSVTSERVFTHANYLMEKDAKPVPIKTEEAYQVGQKTVMFL